ncbi:hypothetical protein [Planktothricoides raciborskii]|uniref:Uncharacterized protein n=1 Tax=Planktothricoides raciborskii FACHB-1370 TaxID=2949576 RepID=A0ABR8EJ50_9CYAN|nr:hypothetical protein [Planktothricoides raciborskii]MBD2545850.1 hypothetical protein [Planktothricoides raciborskii FACHB-1370]MBD2584108.1 hypothetical protein [Planktothricoides raciborskii FACHB-1261]
MYNFGLGAMSCLRAAPFGLLMLKLSKLFTLMLGDINIRQYNLFLRNVGTHGEYAIAIA